LRKRLVSAAVVAVLVIAGSACGTNTESREPGPGEHRMPDGSIMKDSDMGGSSSSAVPRPESMAKLRFLSPSEGSLVPHGKVRVKFGLTGAHLARESSGSIAPNAGYIHLALDSKVVTLTAETDFVLNEIVEVGQIGPGLHVLDAEFVATDHGVFNPRVTARVTFRTK